MAVIDLKKKSAPLAAKPHFPVKTSKVKKEGKELKFKKALY